MIAALVQALQLLTRLPVPSPARPPDERTEAWSAAFFPLVGLLLGFLGWLVWRAAATVLPPGLAAAAVLATWALATGALHEDGLADTADAFGSQRTREGLLRVLKDSRIGSYGALTLALVTVARWQALTAVPAVWTRDAIVASQTLPRAALVWTAWLAGPATEGSGGGLAQALGPGQVAATTAVAAAALCWLEPLRLLPAGAGAGGVALLGSAYFRARLGGVTGDCLGAVALLADLVTLSFYAADAQ